MRRATKREQQIVACLRAGGRLELRGGGYIARLSHAGEGSRPESVRLHTIENMEQAGLLSRCELPRTARGIRTGYYWIARD